MHAYSLNQYSHTICTIEILCSDLHCLVPARWKAFDWAECFMEIEFITWIRPESSFRGTVDMYIDSEWQVF